VAYRDLGEERAKVGGDGQVAALEELSRGAPATARTPAALTPPPRASIAVACPWSVRDCRSRARRRPNSDIVSTTTSLIRAPGVTVQRGEPLAELAQARRELTALVALPRVGVPAAHVGEGHLETHVGADQLGDLPEAIAEPAPRIDRPVGRPEALGRGRLQHLHRLERLAAGSVQEIAHALLVHRLEALPRAGTTGHGRAPLLHVEIAHAAHRDRAHVAAEDARERRPERHRAERRGRLAGRHPGEAAGQPAVGRALHAGGSRLHVILRVEVRAGGVGRAARVGHREAPVVPQRQGSERVQAEEAVEVDGGVATPGTGRAIAMEPGP
jgi:hypothetical protein